MLSMSLEDDQGRGEYGSMFQSLIIVGVFLHVVVIS